MTLRIERGSRQHEIVKGLLGRGGTILGLAAVAHAAGRPAMSGTWSVLSFDIVAATEQVLAFLEKEPNFEIVQSAVMRTMTHEPVTAIPKWAEVLYRDNDVFSFLGNTLEDELTRPALGPRKRDPSPRLRGLAAVAMALCRNQDTLSTLAMQLPAEESRVIKRMARLAQANAGPGQPSSARGKIRRLLKERDSGRDN